MINRLFLLLPIFLMLLASPLQASDWAQKDGYFAKTGGKLGYGLRNSLFGWTQMFVEPYDPKYDRQWEGFCVGIGQSVIYTASGLIQLATFPIPVDFPNVGKGLHLPEPEPPFIEQEGTLEEPVETA